MKEWIWKVDLLVVLMCLRWNLCDVMIRFLRTSHVMPCSRALREKVGVSSRTSALHCCSLHRELSVENS